MQRITIILLVLMTSCASKKTSERVETKSDTLVTKSMEYVSKPIETHYNFSDICDTLGNVRPISFEDKSGDNSAKISFEDNQLIIDLLTGQSKTKTDTIYKTKEKLVTDFKEIIKYKVSPYHWIAHLLSIIVIFVIIRFRSYF